MTDATQGEQLAQRALHAAESIKPFEPRFPFRIRWTKSYDTLFSGAFQEETNVESLLEPTTGGRAILHSHGGTGKTAILRQVFELALGRGAVPVLIDLKGWTSQHYEIWKSLADSKFERAEYLLAELGLPSTSTAELAATSKNHHVFLLVDGLSEVTSSAGREILDTVDGLAHQLPQLQVIAADRFNRRPIRTERWRIGEVCELPDDVVRRFARIHAKDAVAPLLRMAFFLDIATGASGVFTTSSEAQDAYMKQHGGLTPDDFAGAASAAFETYARNRSRVFQLLQFQTIAGKRPTKALIDAGVILLDGDVGFFRHHLFHDFLAARHVAQTPDLWTPSGFDVLTFQATSFDPLVLVLEQLDSQGTADRFVRSVYDWNVYGTAFAIAEGRRRGECLVSHEMEAVIVAMMAERRWDPILATRERASDALSLFRTDLAQEVLRADSFASVSRIIGSIPAESDWFAHWQRIFLGSDVDLDRAIGEVASDDSLVGWTLANVLKRLPLGDSDLERLLQFLDGGTDSTRWRIVHVLGAFPSEENAAALDARMQADDYMWVRYGAARSLVEMAWRAPEPLMLHILARLRELASFLSRDEKILAEVERALFVEPAGPNWRLPALRTLQEFWRNADSAEEEARRYEVMNRFADSYRN